MACRVAQLLAVAALAAAAGEALSADPPAAPDAAALRGAVQLDNGDGWSDSRLRAGVLLDYRLPLSALGRGGDTLDVYGSWSRVGGLGDPRGGAGGTGGLGLDGVGKGTGAGLRYSQLLASGDGHESRLNYGADVRAYKAAGVLQELEPGNDVTVYPLSLNYSGSWILEKGALSGSITVLHNFSGGTRGSQDDFARLRPGASTSYSIVRLAAALTRQLPADFQVRAGVKGQFTGDALLPGEQFGAGGAGGGMLVRGFRERAIANDSGLAAHVELYSPQLCGEFARWQCRALVFYDKGYFRRNRGLEGELGGTQLRSTSVRSVGVGLRVSVSSNVDLQLDYGRVVRSSIVPQQDKNRLHVRLGMTW